jgi:NADH:ubiquinone oxidoreductase subunit 2 (subunit N)
MFMEDEVVEEVPLPSLVPTTGTAAGLAAAAAAVVVLGIWPSVLIDLARQAASIVT